MPGCAAFLAVIRYGTVRPRHGLMNPGSRIPAQASPRASYSPAGMIRRLRQLPVELRPRSGGGIGITSRIGEDFQRAGNVLRPSPDRVLGGAKL